MKRERNGKNRWGRAEKGKEGKESERECGTGGEGDGKRDNE